MQPRAAGAASVRSARQLLAVDDDADAAQVGRAYRRQARLLHPDVSLAPEAVEQFQALQAAYHLVLAAAARAMQPAAPIPTRARRLEPQTRLDIATPWLVAGPVHVRPLPG